MSPHVREGYGVPQVVRNHQKHAQSTYLDEYLRFKKNLVEKFLINIFLEHFVRTQSKINGFLFISHIRVTELDFALISERGATSEILCPPTGQ